MKKIVLILLILTLPPVVTGVTPLNETVIQQGLGISDQPKILTTQNYEKKDYIITLQNINDVPSIQNVENQHRAQKQVQDILTKNLQNSQIVDGKTISAELTPTQKETLEQSHFIKRITKNLEIQKAIQQNKPIIGGHKAEDIVISNKALTGKNQATCVIDTGIDYTHPDFGSCTQTTLQNHTYNLEPYKNTSYQPGITQNWTVQNTSWPTIELYFEYIDIEPNEEIRIISNNEVLQVYTGNTTNTWTQNIPSNSVTIQFKTSPDTASDHNNDGFKVSKIREAQKGIKNCEGVHGGRDLSGNTDIYGYKDTDGHGTHVSGIIAANNTSQGVAPHSKIYAVNVFQGDTSSLSSLTKAVNHCTAVSDYYNISSISMSLGSTNTYITPCEESTLEQAVQQAAQQNISVIAAAGNQGDTNRESFPACLENVYSVAATNTNDGLTSFSNIADTTTIAAPGLNIESTALGTGITTKSGTSMATPFITGATLLINQFNNLTETQNTPIIELAENSPVLDLEGFLTPRAHIGDTLIEHLKGTINAPEIIGKQNFTITYNQTYPDTHATIQTTTQQFTPGTPYVLQINGETLNLTPGNNTIPITYTAGNSTLTQYLNITYDNKTPRITSIQPRNNTNQPGQTVTITIQTDTENTTITYNGTTNNTIPTNTTIPITLTTPLNNTAQTTLLYPKDPNPLNINIHAPQYTNTYNPSITYTANNATTCTQTLNNITRNENTSLSPQTKKGKNTYTVACQRPGYNITNQTTFTIQTQAPRTTLTTPTVTPNTSITLDTKSTIPTTTYYKVNNTAYSEYKDNITLTPGTHKLTYYAEDIAGNKETPKTRTITITKPPKILFNNTQKIATNISYYPTPKIISPTPTNTTIQIENTTKNIGDSFTLSKNKTYNITITATNTFNQTNSITTTINTTTKPFIQLKTPLTNQFSPYKPITITPISDSGNITVTCQNTTTSNTTITTTCQEPTLNINATLTRNNQTKTIQKILTRNNTLPTINILPNQTVSTTNPLDITTNNTDNITIQTQKEQTTILPTNTYTPRIKPGETTTITITATATNKIGNTTTNTTATINETSQTTSNTTGNTTQSTATYTPNITTPLSTHIPKITGLNTTNITIQTLPSPNNTFITYNITTDTARESQQTIRLLKDSIIEQAKQPTNITFYKDTDKKLPYTYNGETEVQNRQYYEYTVTTQNYSLFQAQPNITQESGEDSSSSNTNSNTGGSSSGKSSSGGGSSSGSTGGSLGSITQQSTNTSSGQVENTEQTTTQKITLNTSNTTFQNPSIHIYNPHNTIINTTLTVQGNITKTLYPDKIELILPPNQTQTHTFNTYIFAGKLSGNISLSHTNNSQNITITQPEHVTLSLKTQETTYNNQNITVTALLKTNISHTEQGFVTISQNNNHIATTTTQLENNNIETITLKKDLLPQQHKLPSTILQQQRIKPGTYTVTLQTKNVQTQKTVHIKTKWWLTTHAAFTIFILLIITLTLLIVQKQRA